MIDFEWNAILARIEGLRLITDLAIAGQGRVSGGEGLGVPVRDEAAQIRAAIQRWRSDFDLPEPVRSALDDFELDYVERSQTPLSGNAAAAIANFAMPLLRIGPRVTFLLRNPQEAIRRRAELAFLHLKRAIEATKSVRTEWIGAFETHETSCEKLGASHLLQHGIFAFKVDSNGGRSDMAFAEPTDWRRLPKIVDGLVLTEWKVVRTGAEAEEQSQQAIRQIRRYDEGILGGLELVSPRYVVLVSRKHLQHIPESPHVGSVRYQMVNIPVDPDTPSIRMPSD